MNKDYSKEFQNKYSDLKSLSKVSSKNSLSSIDRIAEFRKKLENTFGSKNTPTGSIMDQDINYMQPKFSLGSNKSVLPRFTTSAIISKNSSLSSIVIQSKPKLNEIIPLESLAAAKKAFMSANEEDIRDLPYLYSFTLNKLCDQIHEKIRNID